MCAHAGTATPASPNPRVLVMGQPTVTMPTQYLVAGCALPTTAGGPCVTAQWTSSATRLLSGGIPLLLFDSIATCVPTGTPLQIVATQTRVTGT
jgi:hypothetical protein